VPELISEMAMIELELSSSGEFQLALTPLTGGGFKAESLLGHITRKPSPLIPSIPFFSPPLP